MSWHLNSKTLEKMVSRIQSASFDALSVIVLNLFGNTSVPFRQVDDNLSLAVKLPREGGWHLLGDAVYTPDVTLREQVKMLGCLESILKNRAKIFIPPIPRFAFGSCCSNSTHGTNINTPLHPHHDCLSTRGSDTQSSNHSTAPASLITRSSTSSTA